MSVGVPDKRPLSLNQPEELSYPSLIKEAKGLAGRGHNRPFLEKEIGDI